MQTAKPRILVVEDEAAIRDGLTDVLVYHGYTVEAVGDGRDGLKKALSGQYDLLLLDVMLPGRDGFSICDEVRKVDREATYINGITSGFLERGKIPITLPTDQTALETAFSRLSPPQRARPRVVGNP